MKFLSLFGTDGFRTFRGMLTGKLLYAPDRISDIDPEILSERDFSTRLEMLISPYTDHNPKLKNICPIIPKNIGTLQEVNPYFAQWNPEINLSILGEYLLAGFFEEMMPEELGKELIFVADEYDSGEAFIKAFHLEKKRIYNTTIHSNSNDELTKYISVSDEEKFKLLNNISARFDGMNIVRILGHMATIIEALHQTEKMRIRFFGDPVRIALPADNMEFLLAGYYLSLSSLPITGIDAISTDHRIIHNFIEKGEFALSAFKPSDVFMVSLYRMLFEASKASVSKIVQWKSELQTEGRFKIDTSTMLSINNKVKSTFATKTRRDLHQAELTAKLGKEPSKISLTAYSLALENKEFTIAFPMQ